MKERWFDKHGRISIGAQIGGSETPEHLMEAKMKLSDLLKKHLVETFCPAIDHYAVALRINASLHNFGKEGVERIRRHRKERYIGADIVIPEEAWRTCSATEFKVYLAGKMRETLEAFARRLAMDRDEVDTEKLFSRLDDAIAEYLDI